ncbi:hypothetical protein [Nocardia donostiensis]|uniref:Uncharacterized protein n=1 Tax=Nocardia donostiensis TaxID=1538463 RepID=A0A1W0AV49_9NOCA|nr:hypothetical protein [Nocardia donostiensis]ONM49088.1 hypothetical protein B0T46_09160 [Nocardia donostiensis]OQS14106.1 hypothetical protein B0T36_16330 [Nocardia donostiensis]OQS19733.1 hypothetical protein B0T44_13055 [Nocardia donostiensis]
MDFGTEANRLSGHPAAVAGDPLRSAGLVPEYRYSTKRVADYARPHTPASQMIPIGRTSIREPPSIFRNEVRPFVA